MTKDHNTEQAVSDPLKMARDSIADLISAMRKYSMDVDDAPPYKHKKMMRRAEKALAALSQVRGKAQEPVAWTHPERLAKVADGKVDTMWNEVHKLDGDIPLYAAAPQVAQEEGARIRGFERSLASVDAYDPQSFIDGAKWAEKKLLAAPQADAQQSEKDVTQIAALIFTDPDGGRMHISSTLTHDHDGTMRFTVKNPETGRRFGVYLGLVELKEEQGR